MVGRMGRWMEGWKDGWVNKRKYGQLEEKIGGQMMDVRICDWKERCNFIIFLFLKKIFKLVLKRIKGIIVF